MLIHFTTNIWNIGDLHILEYIVREMATLSNYQLDIQKNLEFLFGEDPL